MEIKKNQFQEEYVKDYVHHVIVLFSVIFTTALIYKLSGSEKNNHPNVYTYSMTYKIFSTLLSLLMPFIIISIYHSSKFQSVYSSSIYIAISTTLAVTMIYMTLMLFATKISFLKDNRIIMKALFTEKIFSKTDIVEITESTWQGLYIIRLMDGRKIRIYDFLIDFNGFIKRLSTDPNDGKQDEP